jgi:hypothetical protein
MRARGSLLSTAIVIAFVIAISFGAVRKMTAAQRAQAIPSCCVSPAPVPSATASSSSGR